MGNLRSVQKALEQVGAQATISSDPDQVAKAEKLVLPGVGGFGEAIGELRRRSLDQPIVDLIRSGRPFLGICLGLQLLFEVGHEGGENSGLGVLGGEVVRFSGPAFERGSGLKVPHMGWNQIREVQPACPLLSGLPFCAAVWKDNVFATQFHPEKSQSVGLQMLKNFASYNG